MRSGYFVGGGSVFGFLQWTGKKAIAFAAATLGVVFGIH